MRRNTNRLKAARLPCHMTIEGLDFQFQTFVSPQTVLELSQRRSIDNHQNCVLVGIADSGFRRLQERHFF